MLNIKVSFNLLILLVWPLYFSYSQNLVPNASFELSIPKCSLVNDRIEFASSIQYWTRPTSGTSDIYNTLITPPKCVLHMPHIYTTGINLEGTQMPRTGNFLAGLIPFGKRWPGMFPPGYPPIYREYLEVPLIQPLEVGKTYCASMYVSNSKTKQRGSNNLGMYFSDTLIDLDYHEELIFFPQVNESKIIVDSVNWTKISGCFVATSPAKYLLIGNFKPESETTLKFLYFTEHSFDFNYWYSYYFIDDVSVVEYTDVPLIISNDTSICINTKATLSASGPDFIWWSYEANSDTIGTGNDLRISLDTTKNIIAHGKNCNCNEFTDTIKVNVFAQEIFELGNDTILCLDEEIQKSIDNTRFVNPIWNIAFTDPYHISVSEKGKYMVSLSDFNNCAYSDSFNITEIIDPPVINLINDIFICDSYQLHLPEMQYKYFWNDGSIDRKKIFNKGGIYILNSSNVCGVDVDTIVIKDKNEIFASNLVTLNSDDKNENLIISGLPNNSFGYIEIYNRWGDRIYENSQYKNEWPTSDIYDGVYYYYFHYDDCVKIKGWVEIIK